MKGVPTVSSEAEAHEILKSINTFAFFLRVQKGGPTGKTSASPKSLQIITEQLFSPDEYYAWFYEGSQWTTYAGGLLMVSIMLAGVMFPLWPHMMRLGVWYLSVAMLGLIGLFFALAIVRLIFYVITIIVASPGIWIFPQLFADVGFVSCELIISVIAKLVCRSSLSFHYGNGIFQRRGQRKGRRRKTSRIRGKKRRMATTTLPPWRMLIPSHPDLKVAVHGSRKWRTSDFFSLSILTLTL